MRLCGRTSDGCLNVVEITYAVSEMVPVTTEEGKELFSFQLRALDKEGDTWAVKEIDQEEAEAIVLCLATKGRYILGDDMELEYISKESDEDPHEWTLDDWDDCK